MYRELCVNIRQTCASKPNIKKRKNYAENTLKGLNASVIITIACQTTKSKQEKIS